MPISDRVSKLKWKGTFEQAFHERTCLHFVETCPRASSLNIYCRFDFQRGTQKSITVCLLEIEHQRSVSDLWNNNQYFSILVKTSFLHLIRIQLSIFWSQPVNKIQKLLNSVTSNHTDLINRSVQSVIAW